ncbi:hypothetical protein DKX38_024602 [Salix brachista]|uniref:Sugar phosphate transporter domain-containing protein n=1 Tax=Salix brachista TaxID=2182728 RepID=A0A5N5JSF4_9ROSI|nr:hypothetical protein DKX38_024602 [Salix brachista]
MTIAIAGMADSLLSDGVKVNKLWKGVLAVVGIMTTLVIYGLLQEKIMRVPYGSNKEFFKHSLFLVFCNRITTSAVSAATLVASKKALNPVAPVYKYCLISVSNILTTTCQYEALKYVSFPVQTLAKCAKMIPVMALVISIEDTAAGFLVIICGVEVWGTIIMQKRYKGMDYFLALLVTLGCSIFILFPMRDAFVVFMGDENVVVDVNKSNAYWSLLLFMHDGSEISPYSRGRENTVWGVSLMLGYLGFDGFTSTFQDKLFKGYDMEIHNQIFYTTLCSCILSFTGLVLQGHLLPAIDFVFRHNDCLFDIALLSTVATASQFFISYTIRTFGALSFAAVMTTRQLVSIVLSCVWFAHPLSWEQWIGAVIVFGSLYARNLLKSTPSKLPPSEHTQNGASSPVKQNP